MYEHYTIAKKALAKGSATCQRANELATETETKLADAQVILSQVAYMRESLQEQLTTLHEIANEISRMEEDLRASFDNEVQDLDLLDGDLNAALEDLRKTTLPAALAGKVEIKGLESKKKTLFDFADDAAVEVLKGQLRQVIDDLQDSQDNLSSLHTTYSERLRSVEQVLDSIPPDPILRAAGPAENVESLVPNSAMSLKVIATTYAKSQEEHLHQMADLLVSLSQHYDHSYTLFKSESSLPLDERKELQEIVEHDAEQLDDVLTELNERLLDLEEDLANVQEYTVASSKVQRTAVSVFQNFETFDLVLVASELHGLRENRKETLERLDVLSEQLIGLATHYIAFRRSYDALLLEVDRRVKYETAVESFVEQTRQTLERLNADEIDKRDQFLQDHGDTLPGDIWAGITCRPSMPEITTAVNNQMSPHLSQALVEAALLRYEKQ